MSQFTFFKKSEHIKIVRDYNNQAQYNQLDNYDAAIENKKAEHFDILTKGNKYINGYCSLNCFYNEFYLISLKDNPTKANRLYIYVGEDSLLTIDFISEWNDKANKRVARTIKKTLKGISWDVVNSVLKNNFKCL